MISATGIAMSTILRSTRKPLLCMLLIRPNMLSYFDLNGLKRIVRISSKISSIIPPLWFIASFAFVLQRHRAKPIPLFFCKKTIILPSYRILINIFSNFFVVSPITNDVIVKTSLPYHSIIIFTMYLFRRIHFNVSNYL